ncbi:MAG: hypothetical protein ACAF41_19155 [Leptolyngbya sp. BL-A-14]
MAKDLPSPPFGMLKMLIDQPHLSVLRGEGVEKFRHPLVKYKFLSRFLIALCKAIEPVWKTLNFSVENDVENLYITRPDRGKGE